MSKKKHQNEPRRRICVLCGRSIPVYQNDCIVGATGRVVCSACLQTSERRILARPVVKPHEVPKSSVAVTPQEIIAGMDRSIIGQRDAKEAVALALWKQKLNGSFQALKHQYMTSVNAYHYHFRKCARCNKNWFFTEVGREVFCKGCKEPRKEEKDRDNSKRNRETPGYEQKLKALKQAKEWAEWVEKHSTKEAAADFREKLEQMEALWKPYQKNYEEEDDPEKKEALKTEFLRELRKRSRELEERYDDLCRLAEIQPDQR